MIDNRMSVRIISQDDLMNAGCFDVKSAISVCEQAFIEYANKEVIFPDKVSVIFDEKTQNRINCLPAGLINKKIYGMKWVSVFPDNPNKYGVPNLTAMIILSEIEKGYPIAYMEGSLCSNLRTAAVGAIAAKYFARENSRTIGFIGAGEQAKTHFLAMKSIFPSINVCKVASRTKQTEMTFCEQMKKFYPEVQFVPCESDYKEAVKDMDIIVTAISGQNKILKSEWIGEGAFYCHVGGLEDDFSVATKADKIVCDSWEVVKHRTQTISQMYKQGLLCDDDIYADLDEVICGNKSGRESETEFIYFNSVGLSFLDVSLASWMYDKVVDAKKGLDIIMKNRSMFEK